jgi:hypothetical protein
LAPIFCISLPRENRKSDRNPSQFGCLCARSGAVTMPGDAQNSASKTTSLRELHCLVPL